MTVNSTRDFIPPEPFEGQNYKPRYARPSASLREEKIKWKHLHTEVSVDQTQINKFKSLCSPERFRFLRLGFQLDMANFSGVNFTNATNMASTEGDTANITVPQKAQ